MQLFISDLHLDPQRPAITQAFYWFMETYALNAESLYILGDFFEIWLGDDDDTPAYQDIIQQLAQYTKKIPIYFIHGNRDFLIGEAFAKRTGITLLNDKTIIENNNVNVLLMHGDSLCTKDIEYMQFRNMARSDKWQREFLDQPLETRRSYAEKVRAASKTMNSVKPEDIMDVTPEEVYRIMEEQQADILLHGHTHRPDVHTVNCQQKSNQRIVLGDWDKQGWYASLDNNGLILHSFDITSF